MDFQKIRVQNRLRELALNGTFYEIAYDATTAEASLGAAITPSAVEVNEVTAFWSEGKIQRRRRARDRTTWHFEVRVGFDREVVLEGFEKSVSDTLIRLPQDAAEGITESVELRLVKAIVSHPVRSEGNGTRVVYTFDAIPSPQ